MFFVLENHWQGWAYHSLVGNIDNCALQLVNMTKNLLTLRRSAIFTPGATRRRLALQITLSVARESKHDTAFAHKIYFMFNNVTMFHFKIYNEISHIKMKYA